MATELGYTFYPKDYISDPDVMMMTPCERGIYRDLIDLAYMTDNRISYSAEKLANYCNASVEEVLAVLAQKGEKHATKEGEIWSIPSCTKRICKIAANRRNGGQGGRPTGDAKKPKQNPNHNPTTPKTKTQQQRQIEREIEIEIESEIESENKKGARIFGIETIKDEFEKAGYWRENFCGQENIPPDVLTREFDLFLVQIGLTGEYNEVGYNWQKHFYHWRKPKKGKNGAKEVGGVAAGFVVGDVQDFRQAK